MLNLSSEERFIPISTVVLSKHSCQQRDLVTARSHSVDVRATSSYRIRTVRSLWLRIKRFGATSTAHTVKLDVLRGGDDHRQRPRSTYAKSLDSCHAVV